MPRCFHDPSHEWSAHCSGTPASTIDGNPNTTWTSAILFAAVDVDLSWAAPDPVVVAWKVTGDHHNSDPRCLVRISTSEDGRRYQARGSERYSAANGGVGSLRVPGGFSHLRLIVGDHGDVDVRDGFACGWVGIAEVSLRPAR